MLYTDFVVGETTYKLRLNTRAIIKLEKKLNKNPILIFLNKANNNAPTIEEMVEVLNAALQEYHSDTDACTVLDDWVADGHMIGEFSAVIVELYKACGLFKNEEEEKN